MFENEFTRKIDDYAPYISVIYLSDKSKNWKTHMVLWDWTLDLITFFKRLRKSWYSRPMSIKVDFKPTELANKSTLKKQFKKIRAYYDKFFINENDDNDPEETDTQKNTQGESDSKNN